MKVSIVFPDDPHYPTSFPKINPLDRDDKTYPIVMRFDGTFDESIALQNLRATPFFRKQSMGVDCPYGYWHCGGKLPQGTTLVPATTADAAIAFMNEIQKYLTDKPNPALLQCDPFLLEGVTQASLDARKLAQQLGQVRQP